MKSIYEGKIRLVPEYLRALADAIDVFKTGDERADVVEIECNIYQDVDDKNGREYSMILPTLEQGVTNPKTNTVKQAQPNHWLLGSVQLTEKGENEAVKQQVIKEAKDIIKE